MLLWVSLVFCTKLSTVNEFKMTGGNSNEKETELQKMVFLGHRYSDDCWFLVYH